MHRRWLAVVCLTVSACGGGGSPTSPTPPAETRIITLEGNLSYGDVALGQSAERNFRIRNTGTAALAVTGLTGPTGNAFVASWTSGTVPINGSQEVTLRFSPTENRSYSGTLTVNANHTSGINTISINARGLRDLFTRSGIGNTVFDMPTDVTRVRITGELTGGCQNFIIRVGGRLIVNEILGNCGVASGRNYVGEHLVTGGVTEVTNSNGVVWSITELR